MFIQEELFMKRKKFPSITRHLHGIHLRKKDEDDYKHTT